MYGNMDLFLQSKQAKMATNIQKYIQFIIYLLKIKQLQEKIKNQITYRVISVSIECTPDFIIWITKNKFHY